MLGRGFGNGFRGYPGGGFGPGRGFGGRGMMGRGFGPHLFPFGGFLMFLVVLIVLGVVVYALWHAYRKAGMNGAWSLLALIPVFGVPAALLVLAFSEWPVFRAIYPAPAVAPAAPVAPVATTQGETVLVPTAPMTPPGEPVVPATVPDASAAPTEPIAEVKKPRKPKDE